MFGLNFYEIIVSLNRQECIERTLWIKCNNLDIANWDYSPNEVVFQ